MYKIETKRLIGFTDLIITDGFLRCSTKPTEINNILEIRPTSGRESSFLFYDKNSQETLICHIGITWQRGRTEISYGTVDRYRGNGLMQEALKGFLAWVVENTLESQIWGLPNGEESQHILEKCGFCFYGKVEEHPSCSWFLFAIDR